MQLSCDGRPFSTHTPTMSEKVSSATLAQNATVKVCFRFESNSSHVTSRNVLSTNEMDVKAVIRASVKRYSSAVYMIRGQGRALVTREKGKITNKSHSITQRKGAQQK